jgi:SAM-dependent methyltransferase
MGLWGRIWNLAYLRRTPWDVGGPRPELMRLVESDKLEPCRAIDLGCGEGDNVIYLAQQGFDVVGVDISPRAIAKARRKAKAAEVSPTLLVGDVTNLTGIEGPFDLVVDNGCLHSLMFNDEARKAYVRTVLRLTHPGTHYFLRCFVKNPQKRLSVEGVFSVGMMEPGEVERRFVEEFNIENLEPLPPGLTSMDAVYLLERKGSARDK